MKLQTLKNLRSRPLGIAVAATLLVASVAHADTESPKLKLAGFVDAAEGTELIAGDYATVIEKLAPHSFAFDADEVAASTNLCVAYVAMGGWMKPTTPVTKPSRLPAWISGAEPSRSTWRIKTRWPSPSPIAQCSPNCRASEP